jgi:hypothetical protein
VSYDLLGPARFKLADGDFGVGAAEVDLKVAVNVEGEGNRDGVIDLIG